MKIPHLEKVILFISIIIFGVLTTIFTTDKNKIIIDEINYSRFEIKSKSGESYFLFSQPLSIMPGEFIHIYNRDNELQDKYEVESILIPSREEVTVFTENETITGTTRQEIILENKWQDSQAILALRNGRENSQIRFADIKRIKGILYININADIKTLNNLEYNISFYQKSQSNNNTAPDKIKWTNGLSDKNLTIYDMFTPPIIFIHDGQLTTKLPEKEEEPEDIEPFGLSLVEVTKAEYPFRLKSWVGETPYFEDLTVTEASGIGVRNRIEVGKPYKRILNRKPGQPSLEICDNNDSDKIFVVQYFAVQQYRNPNTGGLKPVGRAMIKDFRIEGDPFEINSLMEKVYAGSLKMTFRASLPGLTPEDVTFDSSDYETVFDYGGRRYHISSIDFENKMIRIAKLDPRSAEDTFQSFSF
jgi:hypothetical protein